MNNKKTLTKLICTNLAIVILLCFCSSLFCGCGRNNLKKATFISSGNTLEEFEDLDLLGTEVNVTLYGKTVIAVYEKTVRHVLDDITERQYRVLNVEKDGVVEPTSSSHRNYIGLNDEGEIIHYSIDNIMYTGLKCKYDMNDENMIKYGYSFGMTKEEIRLHMEPLLGDITDWSLYNDFNIEFLYGSVDAMIHGSYSNSISADFIWSQKNGVTIKKFSCTVMFGLFEEVEGGKTREFLENAYITKIEINEPFGDVTDLSPYIESSKKIKWQDIQQALYARFSTVPENGYKYNATEFGKLRMYDGKICYVVDIECKKQYTGVSDHFMVYAIFPLE